uniref:Uncharacterized protein n=1 Tax=virus sp. ctBM815 TaxID=2825806 RepID=A0A8S5RKI7_9VIRU|nr:MAG TPA: hypothetical protein [virus sp. ctBM815]
MTCIAYTYISIYIFCAACRGIIYYRYSRHLAILEVLYSKYLNLAKVYILF